MKNNKKTMATCSGHLTFMVKVMILNLHLLKSCLFLPWARKFTAIVRGCNVVLRLKCGSFCFEKTKWPYAPVDHRILLGFFQFYPVLMKLSSWHSNIIVVNSSDLCLFFQYGWFLQCLVYAFFSFNFFLIFLYREQGASIEHDTF